MEQLSSSPSAQPSLHGIPVWLSISAGVLGAASFYLLLFFVHCMHSVNYKNCILDLLFFLNVCSEAYVTMRSQLPHTTVDMFLHAAFTTFTSFAAICSLAQDIYINGRKRLPLQGRTGVVVNAGQLRIVPFFRHKIQTMFHFIKLVSIHDKLRVGACFVQFIVRIMELVARGICLYFSTTPICRPLSKYDISIVPMVFAFFCWAKILIREKKAEVTALSCILVGDTVRLENPNPTPPSVKLLNRIVQGRTHIAKTFDMWSFGVENTTFNMFELRGNVDNNGWDSNDFNGAWNFPPTEFAILYFSLTDEVSYNRVTDVWVPRLNNHAPKVRVILVGTKRDERDEIQIHNNLAFHVTLEEGEALAGRANAVEYLECNCNITADIKYVFEQIRGLA